MVTIILTISCVKNNELKSLTDKLRANKISLNESEIKLVIFRPRRKLYMITNFILTPTKAFTYLRFVINKNISWEKRMKFLKKILSRTTTVLCIYHQTVFHPQSRRQQKDRGHVPLTFLHSKKKKRNKVKKEKVLKQSY